MSALERLSTERCLERLAGGAALVDLREPAAFSAGHPPGALSMRFDDRHLAERVAKIVPQETAVVLLADGATQATAAAAQLRAADRAVLGVIDPAPDAWAAAGAAWVTLASIASDALAEDQASRSAHVLDVREPLEWELGYVPGAQLIALGELWERIAEVPRDREVAVICESGNRSASAASLLQAAGFTRVSNVIDGTAGYRGSGRSLESASPQREGG
ncbi:MAG: hypothetical protein GEU80_12085 [Dehalococcoidia bacterium]|nr:hypothetical protein [Dehalococcoidia bacterium]